MIELRFDGDDDRKNVSDMTSLTSDDDGSGTPFDLVDNESTTNMTAINDTALQTTAGAFVKSIMTTKGSAVRVFT